MGEEKPWRVAYTGNDKPKAKERYVEERRETWTGELREERRRRERSACKDRAKLKEGINRRGEKISDIELRGCCVGQGWQERALLGTLIFFLITT